MQKILEWKSSLTDIRSGQTIAVKGLMSSKTYKHLPGILILGCRIGFNLILTLFNLVVSQRVVCLFPIVAPLFKVKLCTTFAT